MTAVSIEDLLEHSDWICALSRRLLRDEARAEDAVQETWVEALRNPPRGNENLRGWLATVLANAVRRGVRGEARRTVREAVVARDEAQPSSSDVVERACLQRHLAGHVLDLREPYRTALLLRWFEGLSQGEIAARTGVTSEAVHTRLRRGHALLRERLDAEYGDRGTWCSALAPLASLAPLVPSAANGNPNAADTVSASGSSLPKASIGTGTMITLATGSLAALGLTAALFHFGVAPTQRVAAASVDPAVGSAPDTSGEALPGANSGRTLAAVAGTEPAASEGADQAALSWTVRGTVFGADGSGLAGAGLEAFLVRGEETEPLGTTTAGEEGTYQLDLSQLAEFTLLERLPGQLELRAFAPGHLPRAKRTPLPDGSAPLDPVAIALHGGVLITGRVLDATGQPLSGAPVLVGAAPAPNGGQLMGPEAELEAMVRGLRSKPSVVTGADGSYRLGATSAGRLQVSVDDEALGAAQALVETNGTGWIQVPDIVLETKSVLAGVLQYPDGAPAAGVKFRVARIPSAPERQERDARLQEAKRELEDAGHHESDLSLFEILSSESDDGSYVGGRSSASTVTDSDGGFRLEGLSAGDYIPFLAEGKVERIASGTVDVQLVHRVPSVTIELRDREGRPLPGYKVHGLDGVSSGPDASVRCDLPFSKVLRYHVNEPGIAPVSGEVVLAEGEWSARRTLVLEPALPPGSLALSVTGPEGEVVSEIELTLVRPGAEMMLTAARLGLTDELDVRRIAGDGIVTDVEVGEWTVILRPDDPTLQALSRSVTVASGTETAFGAVLEPGGFLVLQMPELPTSALKGDPSLYYGCHLELASGEQLDLVPRQRGSDREPWLPGLLPGQHFQLGLRNAEHPALPPGHHTLVLRAVTGSHESRLPVTLVAGHTAEVSFQYPVAAE